MSKEDLSPRDSFDKRIDEWLSSVPLLPGFRDFFVEHVQNMYIEFLQEVYKKSTEVYKGEGRCIALPGDIFKAIKILELNYYSGDIEVFYEHYKKQLDETPEKLEVKALYEHFVKYKEAREYTIESGMTGEARSEQLRCAAQAHAKWKDGFIKDIFLKFPPAVSTTGFGYIKKERKLKAEGSAEYVKDETRKAINVIKQVVRNNKMLSIPNILGLKEYQEYFLDRTKDYLKDLYAKSQFLSLQRADISEEQKKLITEACDNMIKEMDMKAAERGFNDLSDTVAGITERGFNDDILALVSSPDVPHYDVFVEHMVDQSVKRRRLDFDLNASPDDS